MAKGYKDMLAEADALVQSLSVAEMERLRDDPQVVLVDIRDPRELAREGMIPDAFHAPRGMLEFWIDPESPYHKPQFAAGKRIVFYCASGWRSALAGRTAIEMGLPEVSHLQGGITAWKQAGGAVETR